LTPTSRDSVLFERISTTRSGEDAAVLDDRRSRLRDEDEVGNEDLVVRDDDVDRGVVDLKGASPRPGPLFTDRT
jgi:hypothetical protein